MIPAPAKAPRNIFWIVTGLDRAARRLPAGLLEHLALVHEQAARHPEPVPDMRMLQTEWRPESLRIAQQVKAHAEARGITAGQFAVAWVLNNRLVTSVIGGPRTEEQWDDYLGALSYRFTAEDEALIDRLVPSGHPSTPGYNDPAYPIEGRAPRSGG